MCLLLFLFLKERSVCPEMTLEQPKYSKIQLKTFSWMTCAFVWHKSRVSQLPFIYLYNTNTLIISLIMVNTLLLFHVESLMFDVCADKALLKLLCICCKWFLLSSIRIKMTPISQLGKRNRQFGKWVLSQKVLNIFSGD